ncbi:MAG: hypothetical protein D6798_14605 [Deltaproteobacteria bacterium]|nr:MAG: hypothetical protein D6798_14605 [Deltaproteobacteria bacterium]
MASSLPPPPALRSRPRPDRGALRRRGVRIGLGIGGAIIGLAALVALAGDRRDARPVVLSAPAGSRVAVDGDPQPVLGSDGTHLLRIRPGHHRLDVTLRNGTVVTEEVDIEDGDGAILLELRFSRVTGRWDVFVDKRQ